MSNLEIILGNVLSDLIERYTTHLTAIYGIGSFFDESLPSDWIKNDIDLIAIVDDLSIIPEQDWTNARFEQQEIDGIDVFIGFNTIEMYQSKEKYNEHSFANYKWSLIDIKNPNNSKRLYGADISEQLPDPATIEFDYPDLLARSLYHLNKSIIASKAKRTDEAMRQLTKGVFKFLFYLCGYFDPGFDLTSIRSSATRVQQIARQEHLDSFLMEMVEKAIKFRRTGTFEEDFNTLRAKFITLVFSMLSKGILHEKLNYIKLKATLSRGFGDGQGFHKLINFLTALKKHHKRKLD